MFYARFVFVNANVFLGVRLNEFTDAQNNLCMNDGYDGANDRSADLSSHADKMDPWRSDRRQRPSLRKCYGSMIFNLERAGRFAANYRTEGNTNNGRVTAEERGSAKLQGKFVQRRAHRGVRQRCKLVADAAPAALKLAPRAMPRRPRAPSQPRFLPPAASQATRYRFSPP